MATALVFLFVLAILFGGYLALNWTLYALADRAQLNARGRTNFAYVVVKGSTVQRVVVIPVNVQQRQFYEDMAKDNSSYKIPRGKPGLVWVGYPPNMFQLASWAPTTYHQYTRGGIRHAVPLSILRIDFPFQPTDEELKALNAKAEKARASFEARERNPGQAQSIELSYLTPDEADKLLYIPNVRSQDQIEMKIWAKVYVMILDPYITTQVAANFENDLHGVIVPRIRSIAASNEFMVINATEQNGNGQSNSNKDESAGTNKDESAGVAESIKKEIVRFSRDAMIQTIARQVREDVGVMEKQPLITTYKQYKAECKKADTKGSNVLRRALRDWGIYIIDIVIEDVEEASGELSQAAEKFAKTKLEQAGRLVTAETTRREKILLAQGDQAATEHRIRGFVLGKDPNRELTPDGRAAFLDWFYKDALREGISKDGRTILYQWPNMPGNMQSMAPVYNDLKTMIQAAIAADPSLADPEKLIKHIESLLGGSKPPAASS